MLFCTDQPTLRPLNPVPGLRLARTRQSLGRGNPQCREMRPDDRVALRTTIFCWVFARFANITSSSAAGMRLLRTNEIEH